MGSKSATMYQEEFAYLFEIFDKARKEGQTVFPDWKILEFENLTNMTAIQKCLGIGIAAKSIVFFVTAALSSLQQLWYQTRVTRSENCAKRDKK